MSFTESGDTYSSGYVFYSQRIQEDEENRQYIIENLDRAITEKWIHVYLQPIIRAVNGQVCDVEALARWIDPEKGMLSPADFIPILEDTKLIYKVDLHILDVILERIKKQQEKGKVSEQEAMTTYYQNAKMFIS